MNFQAIRFLGKLILVASFLALGSAARVQAQGAGGPKLLFDPTNPTSSGQVAVDTGKEDQVTTSVDKDGVEVKIKPGPAGYPGLTIKPAEGSPWNLSAYGHVEAKVTNTGTKEIELNLRVDNDGDYTQGPWNTELKKIGPGQTKTIRVYFGYSYGFRPAFQLNSSAVIQVLFFTGKTDDELNFRIGPVLGAGWVGEKIGVDPDHVTAKLPGNVILDAATAIKPDGQISAIGGAKGSAGPDGKFLQADFDGAQDQAVTFRPAKGLWNLNEGVEVRLKFKNIGSTAVTPSARVESEGGPTDVVAAAAPLAPGAEGEIVIPFASQLPWKSTGGGTAPDAGTGTNFVSNFVTGVTLLSDKTDGAKSLLVTSIVADVPPLTLPDWLGKRPPVDGDWVQTFNENFDGDMINLHTWNVHGPNWYDKRMHFAKEDVIVKDGQLRLRLEKKTGVQNDDPRPDTEFKGAYSGAQTDYAAGNIDSFGKWTQRYGYFEIREKQPTGKCLWPGFWFMPDRGLQFGKDKMAPSRNDPNLPWDDIQNSNVVRGTTADGGMEFDITESQSAWGIHRFNVACHWDGGSFGTSGNYVQADADGYITVGMLWLPGSLAVYGNGKEIFRWENPRVASQQEYLIVQNQIGGWDNEPMDDALLPADFLVDYIRVWQRKDLATPEDGPKPNKGDVDAYHE